MRRGELVVLTESDQRKPGRNFDMNNFKIPTEVFEMASMIIFQQKDTRLPCIVLKDRWNLTLIKPIRM